MATKMYTASDIKLLIICFSASIATKAHNYKKKKKKE